MSVVAIVAEYNPFHNGHLLHLQKSKETTNSKYVVVIMSGNFVQRGEPAIFDKYLRTKMALECGADVVVELPLFYSSQSAENFAFGAIKIANSLGIVNSICFGTENGSLKEIDVIAKLLANESVQFKEEIRKNLKLGISFPKARENALKSFIDFKEINLPNNILAIEYLKQLHLSNSNIEPYTIKREVAGYHDTFLYENIQSATAIRKSIFSDNLNLVKNVVPNFCFEAIENEIKNVSGVSSYNLLSPIFQYIVKSKTPSELEQIYEIAEGLENRIKKVSGEFFSLTNIVSHLKTKRYTFTKIQRTILNIILDIKKDDIEFFNNAGGPQYIRILGFRKESQHILRQIEQNATLPLITNIKNCKNSLSQLQFKMLEKEIKSTDIYYLSKTKFNERCMPCELEYKKPLVIV